MFPWNMLPFNPDMKKMFNSMKPGDLDKYVNDMFGKLFNENIEGMTNPNDWMKTLQSQQRDSRNSSQPLGASVFETHDHVYIRLQLKDESWMKNMKIYHTTNQAIIENIPETGDKQTITLPVLVKKKGASAIHKDGMLEIKIPKSIDLQFSEVDVKDNL